MANKFERAAIAINAQIEKLKLEIAKLEQQKKNNKDLFFCAFYGDSWITKNSDGSFTLRDYPSLSGVIIVPKKAVNDKFFLWETFAAGISLYVTPTQTNDEKTIILLFRNALLHIKKAVKKSNNS
jgi:hypothetical protein